MPGGGGRLLTNPLWWACRLMVEWRIQKRVEEQFNSFLSGFNELIPQDLINVFDERELEVRWLLVGLFGRDCR
jgi:hypothetical protein